MNYIKISSFIFVLMVFFSNCSPQSNYETTSGRDISSLGGGGTDDGDDTGDGGGLGGGGIGDGSNSSNHVFKVEVVNAGPRQKYLDNYVLQIDMDFNSSDINKKGAIFLTMTFGFETYLCTNRCTSSVNWKLWSATDTTTKWSVSGLLAAVGVDGLGNSEMHNVFDGTLDMTKYGGATLSMGYGLGNTEAEAAREMMATGRTQTVTTLIVQNADFLVGTPETGSNILSRTNYYLRGLIVPSTADYDKPGYYFVVAQLADGTVTKALKSDKTWVDLKSSDLSDLATNFYKKVSKLTNLDVEILNSNISDPVYTGAKVYVGYGVGLDAAQAVQDLLSNEKFNKTPFEVK